MIRGKKGEGQDILYPQVLFTLLNLIFFSLLLVFVSNSSEGALVYEESYAKQIALLIDKAEGSTTFFVDFEKGLEIAEKNKILQSENLVRISNNEIVVKLSDSEGYRMKYFSDNEIVVSFEGKKLIVQSTERQGA